MKGINKENRELVLSIRISSSELSLVTKLQQKRKSLNSKRSSRADIIIDALKYADGQIIF